MASLEYGGLVQGQEEVATPLRNPSFEDGLSGWTATGTAFRSQPTYGENVRAERMHAVTLGGDYWTDLAFPIGVQGDHWIGSYENRPDSAAPHGRTQGEGPRGRLRSSSFRIPDAVQYISLLVGGGADTGQVRVELLRVVRAGCRDRYEAVDGIAAKAGNNSELMRRDFWDVRRIDRSQRYVVRVVDDSSGPWGHINVDDIRFLDERPDLATVDGHPAVLQTTIGDDTVWTDYDAPLWGSADLHTHPMSHLSMGGSLMHGVPDAGSLLPRGTRKQGDGCNAGDERAGTVARALGDCSAIHGGWGVDNLCGDTIRAFAINVAMDDKYVHQLPLIPTDGGCPDGMENDAGLCYAECPDGFGGAGFMCHRDCPAGLRDDGLYCGKPEGYGRGIGYVDDGRDSCEAAHPGGCEQCLALYYPHCGADFHAVGCNVCSPNCPAGWSDIGVSCAKPLASCPPGFRDDGLYCAKPEAYGRGGGYPWQFGDGFNLNAARARCEADHAGGCEEWGAIMYPRCRTNFHNAACCLCSPDCPAGWEDIGVSCTKPATSCPPGFRDDGLFCAKPSTEYGRGFGFGVGDGRARCESEHPEGCEKSGALWYPACREGFHAFGCCWCTPNCPDGWEDIGVSCLKPDSFVREGGLPPPSNLHGDHPHAGYPALSKWPHWSSISHQQMYVDWIERAHGGGLNLLVALAVNNELLGAVVNGGLARDDRTTADLQIDEIRAFIERHAFMTEVRTPVEYRQAVRNGLLAVIIGVEVDNIGNFNVGNPGLMLPEDIAVAEIRRLHDEKNIRYIFPLHFADNVFGGVAVKGALFNLSNRFARSRPLPLGAPIPPGLLYGVEHSDDPRITYRLSLFPEEIDIFHGAASIGVTGLLAGLGEIPFPPAFHITRCPIPRLKCVSQFALIQSLMSPDPTWDMYAPIPTGHANIRGLSELGEAAILEMMRLGMIIDIDHMSERAADRTLELASEHQYPLVSGHTGFRAFSAGGDVSENTRTEEQLASLSAINGIMGVGWAGGTTADFLVNYRFGVALGAGPALSLGSDINGFEVMPQPRHGNDVQPSRPEGISDAQWNSRVQYGADGLQQYTMAGSRSWDFNADGVAHIGMYPDAYQDLRNLGMSFEERSEFFSAVDAFARSWDQIERQKSTIP